MRCAERGHSGRQGHRSPQLCVEVSFQHKALYDCAGEVYRVGDHVLRTAYLLVIKLTFTTGNDDVVANFQIFRQSVSGETDGIGTDGDDDLMPALHLKYSEYNLVQILLLYVYASKRRGGVQGEGYMRRKRIFHCIVSNFANSS